MIFSVCFFVLGFLVALTCTPLVIGLSRKGVGLDDPNENRKHHDAPIPRLGGMPIMLATSIGLIVILSLQPHHSTTWFPILFGSLCMYGLGLWDDLKPL